MHAPWGCLQSAGIAEDAWPLALARILIPEDREVQGNMPSGQKQLDEDGADLPSRPSSGKTSECLASPCLGAVDHPALQHIIPRGWGALLFQMLPPNRTSASTTSQVLTFRNFFLLPFMNIELKRSK